jgi:hypothetical protein
LRRRPSPPDCRCSALAITLAPQQNKRPEALARSAGSQDQRTPGTFEAMSISFLPTTFTTLFALAVSLLLGYL